MTDMTREQIEAVCEAMAIEAGLTEYAYQELFAQALTAIRQLQRGWRGIESAPKDGTYVLVFGNVWAGEISGIVRNDNGDVSIARYTDGKSDYPGDWWDDVGGDAYACWCQPTRERTA